MDSSKSTPISMFHDGIHLYLEASDELKQEILKVMKENPSIATKGLDILRVARERLANK